MGDITEGIMVTVPSGNSPRSRTAETSEVLQKHMTDNQMNYLVSLKEPPSPGRPPIELQQCIEELLRHTIASSVSGNLETDIGLSKELCTNLLNDDPSNPTVPLYKRLATSIYRFISSGSILQSDSRVAVKHDACSLKQKEDEFNKLAWEKGRELLYMLERVDFELNVQEPFFSYLKSGEKTIEGRCAIGHYNKIEVGASILFNKCLVLQVKDVRHYDSFHEMLEAEPLSEVLPGVDSIEEGVQVYRNFYTEEKERSNGVLAICVTKPVWQPYLSMATIISDLRYEGLQNLLHNAAHS